MDRLNQPRQKFNKTYVPNGVIDIYKKEFVKKIAFEKMFKHSRQVIVMKLII